MRHLHQKATLGRETSQRKALMCSLAESLILHGGIKTTLAKARALRIFVEPLITRAKKNTLTARRLLKSSLHTDKAVDKLLKEIGPKYIERAGGYTRIIKMARRPNDAAETARIELV
jgi:large subunit ribosomal protein L17